jgi:hypothetical protein
LDYISLLEQEFILLAKIKERAYAFKIADTSSLVLVQVSQSLSDLGYFLVVEEKLKAELRMVKENLVTPFYFHLRCFYYIKKIRDSIGKEI